MIPHKWLLSLYRIPHAAVMVLVTAMLAVIAQLFVGNWLWLAFAYVPPAVLLEELSRSPKFVAYLNGKRNLIALCTGLALLGAGVVYDFILLRQEVVASIGDLLSTSSLQFFLLALLFGVLLRQVIARLGFLALLGRRRLGTNLIAMVLWTLIIIFYPQPPHSEAAGLFFAGLGLGILLHKGSTLRVTQAVAGWRRLQEVVDAWPPRARATKDEFTALQLLSSPRQLPSMQFKKLRAHLKHCSERNTWTKRLRLISACVCRLEGSYEEALKEADQAANPPEQLVDTHLSLLRVLCLEDLGRQAEAQEMLEQLLRSAEGACCPMSAAVAGRRAAEAEMETSESIEPKRIALDHVLRAFELRREIMQQRALSDPHGEGSVDEFLRKFLEVGIPVTASLFMDALGMGLLVAGDVEEGRLLLQRCIKIDPDYSYGYLHLGDFFWSRRRLVFGRGPNTSDLWHAKACYTAAILAERNKGSRVRRLARQRLNAIQRVSVADE